MVEMCLSRYPTHRKTNTGSSMQESSLRIAHALRAVIVLYFRGFIFVRATIADDNKNDARQILPGKIRRRCRCDVRRVRVAAANVRLPQ